MKKRKKKDYDPAEDIAGIVENLMSLQNTLQRLRACDANAVFEHGEALDSLINKIECSVFLIRKAYEKEE